FFEYAKVGLPILIIGILYFAIIGRKLLPKREETDLDEDSIYAQQVDYSNVPKWKQIVALGVLILTVIAMIFEKQIVIPLYISSWIGALILVVTRVITEKKSNENYNYEYNISICWIHYF